MYVAWLRCRAVIARTPSARAACLFWARHLVLCLRLGESEVSVCGPGGNPQASVVFASLPVLVLTQTLTDTHSGRPPVSDCVTLLGGNVGHVTCPKSLQPACRETESCFRQLCLPPFTLPVDSFVLVCTYG